MEEIKCLPRHEVEAALERVVATKLFQDSPQLSAFLRYIVEAALRGRPLKAYTVAVEALGRPSSFDAQLDPIVRVEAARLRRALDRYYAGPGFNDPLIIDLARGTYLPTFRYGHEDVAPAVLCPPKSFSALNHSSSPLLALTVPVILLAAIGFLGFYFSADALTLARQNPWIYSILGSPLPPGNGMPTISIRPLEVVGKSKSRNISASLLSEKLRDAFVRFDTVNVVTNNPLNFPDSSAVTKDSNSDYQFSGVLEYGDTLTTASFKLVETASGSTVWSREFNYERSKLDEVRPEEEMVTSIATSLLQSYGIIRSRDRTRHLASSSGDPRYRCVLEAADAFRSASRDDHLRARACLERLTAMDPAFAVGFSFLAAVYLREHQLGLDRGGEKNVASLDRAFAAARRAVELNPGSARAHQMLFLVLFSRRDVPGAFAAAEKAIALNKYDLLLMSEYGSRLIMVGETEKGMALLHRFDGSDGVRPSWHYFYLFLGSYLSNDFAEANRYAGYLSGDYPPMHLAKFLVASKSGDSDLKRQSLDRLLALKPNWGIDSRHELQKMFPNSEIVERLASDLREAGLSSSVRTLR